MAGFTGRERDIRLLQQQLDIVATGSGGTSGQAILMSGRRRVGKSRLAQEFCDQSKLPFVFFQATKGRQPQAERADFLAGIAQSTLPDRELVAGVEAQDWNQALRSLAVAASAETPNIIVIDEVPWLLEQDLEFEGALQTIWDRHLAAKPIFLILVGSDLSVMESLGEYGRPFFGRAAHMRVRPLDPNDVQEMIKTDAVTALDATIITGGFPEIVKSWKPGTTPNQFLKMSAANPLSPLLASGELVLLGEFPQANYARAVLEAIGSGERTFAAIANKVGGPTPIPSGTLAPILANLTARKVVSIDSPLSTIADTKNKRYRIEDPYLRFWLAFLRQGIAEAERGRGDLVLRRIKQSWTTFRGRAIEPIVREALRRLLPNDNWPDVEAIGGWWNRQNNPEIDLIGADQEPVASRIHFVGSIKWLEYKPFSRRDYEELRRAALSVPGVNSASADIPLVAVSRAGTADNLELAECWGPDDLVSAWRRN